jgi:hypothetical protein
LTLPAARISPDLPLRGCETVGFSIPPFFDHISDRLSRKPERGFSPSGSPDPLSVFRQLQAELGSCPLSETADSVIAFRGATCSHLESVLLLRKDIKAHLDAGLEGFRFEYATVTQERLVATDLDEYRGQPGEVCVKRGNQWILRIPASSKDMSASANFEINPR